MEDNLRRAFALSGGEISIFFGSTINNVLWAMTLAIFCVPMLVKFISKKYSLGKKNLDK